MKRTLLLAAAAFLIAAPISLAQTTPQTPPTSQQPSTPPSTMPSTPPSSQPATPATPATPGESPATPASPSASSGQTQTAQGEPQGCRTRKPAGEECACRSEPDRVGTSTEHPAGHNVCVRPE